MNKLDMYEVARQLFWRCAQPEPMISEASQTPLREGKYDTVLPNVRIFHQIQAPLKECGVYSPCLVFIFSGAKHGELGHWRFTYDVDHYLLLTSTYPLQCKIDATLTEPLLGIQIELDRSMVSQLLHDIGEFGANAGDATPVNSKISGIECCPMDGLIRRYVGELLLTLFDPLEARLFGVERVRALIYALLQGEGGRLLQHWNLIDGQFSQFQKAVAYIQAHYNKPLDIETLAAQAGLSAASLNRVFKRYASDSPIQYLKKIRLNLARLHLIQAGASVQQAAYRVGYESPSQFSREFKRYFGYAPKRSSLLGLT